MNLDNKITAIMTSQVICAEAEGDIRKVTQTMKTKNIRHLPVVKNRKCVGIVSKTDIN
jgi:CBS domain-containing protein